MSLTINKKDSEKTIRETIQKAAGEKEKNPLILTVTLGKLILVQTVLNTKNK